MLAERITLNFQAEQADQLVMNNLTRLRVIYNAEVELGNIEGCEIYVSPSMPFVAGNMLFYAVTIEVTTY